MAAPDQGRSVQDYRLFILSEVNHIVRALEFEAEDDAAALEHAEQHRDGADMELWNRNRFVQLIPRLSTPGP